MKIVIVAGGTGSIALQNGLYRLIDQEFDGVDTKVLVNAYDNGLSTGAVRRVMGGRILGPSDVRKNQTTRLKLEQPSSPWLSFLDIRFTVESSKAKEFCMQKIDALDEALTTVDDQWMVKKSKAIKLIREAVDVYFSIPVAAKIDYNDFSLANIVYAGFAAANGNSLRKAATIMAGLMGIKDNVILNDDTSLFLGAITKSGLNVTDEGDIVSWNNPKDPFVDVFFFDHNGHIATPMLCDEARDALEQADLIILSSGTQWSSLIPTYATEGFTEAVRNSQAKIIMVMNRQPDKDAPGQTGVDIINTIIPRYIDPERVHLIVDETGSPALNGIDDQMKRLVQDEVILSVNQFNLKCHYSSKDTVHDEIYLGRAVILTYFGDYVKSEHIMFDYDDTLVGRGNAFPKASAYNKKYVMSLKNRVDISICTGNSIKAVTLGDEHGGFDLVTGERIADSTLTVFADGGVNKYRYTATVNNTDDAPRHDLLECVDPSVRFPATGTYSATSIINTLNDHGIPLAKIENRGNVTISIKPIDEEYRPALLSLVKMLVNHELSVKATGRTTIDISHPKLSKAAAVRHVLDSGVKSLTFVGDEFAHGNDSPVLAMNDRRVKCVNVNSPAETALFLKALTLSKHEPRN